MPHPYVRKTRDYWAVEGQYAAGWEELTEEPTLTEARQCLREYNRNEPGTPHRIRLRRERLAVTV